MEIISIPRLRMAQLQSLAESSLDICKNTAALESSCANVQEKLDAFIQGMTKDFSSVIDKKTADYKRDHYITGLFSVIRAERYYPHSEESIIEALLQLSQFTDKYGKKITRYTYNEETAAIDNMLADYSKITLPDSLKALTVRWITLIEAANTEFKAASSDLLSDKVEAASIESATSLAPELISGLEGLYTMSFALLKINPADEALLKTYNSLSTLVDTYR